MKLYEIGFLENYFELSQHEIESVSYMIIEGRKLLEKEFKPDGYNIGINIELKPNKGLETKTVKIIVDLLKKNQFPNKIFFSSFNFDTLILLRKLLPNIGIGFLIDSLENQNLRTILQQCNKKNFFLC